MYFFACTIPFLNRAGFLKNEFAAIFRDPESCRDEQLHLLKEFCFRLDLFAPIPIVRIWLDSKQILLQRLRENVVLPAKAIDLRRYNRSNSVYPKDIPQPTHETCHNDDIWGEPEKVSWEELPRRLAELVSNLSFVHEEKDFYDGVRTEPEKFKEFLLAACINQG